MQKQFRLVAGRPETTASLAVACRPKTDYAAAASALLAAGRRELHLVYFSEENSLPPAAVRAARRLGARPTGLHVSAVFGSPPGPGVFKGMAGIDLSPYVHIRAGRESRPADFRRLASSAAAARRAGYKLRAFISVAPAEAAGLGALLAELARNGVHYAFLNPDPGAGLTKMAAAAFARALALAVARVNKVREGDHPPSMQIENTLADDEAGFRPADPLLFDGKTYPVNRLLAGSLRAAGAGGAPAATGKAFLDFGRMFAVLMRGQAMQWTDRSENAWITRALLDGDMYSQRRFIRRNLSGLESVFLFIASGCLNDCIFCQRKIPNQNNDLADIYSFIDTNRRIGHQKLSLLGNEPLLEPAIIKIVARARASGFRRVEMMTSGNMLSSAALCRRLAAAGLTEVSIPLMGCSAQSHDALTASPGSFRDTVAGIKNAAAAGLRVYTHTNVLKQNLAEIPGIEAFARKTLKTPFCIFSLRPKTPGSMRTPYAELVPSYSEMVGALAGRVNSLIGFPLCVQRRIQGRAEVPENSMADSVKLYMLHQNYTKPEKCDSCAAAARCIGTFDSYTALYGDGELEAIAA